jgi:hypothetical protein
MSTYATIDLFLIDLQSVGKRSLHLMDVNAKKRWTLYWRVNKFLKESHIVTRLVKDRASFLKFHDIDDVSFLENLTLLLFYSVSGNANSMYATNPLKWALMFLRLF